MTQLNQIVGEDLHFNTKYSKPFWVQLKVCVGSKHGPTGRIHVTMQFVFSSLVHALYSWETHNLLIVTGAMFASVGFLGSSNASSVQLVVHKESVYFYIERTAAGLYAALPHAISKS